MYEVLIEPDEVAELIGGEVFKPVLTLADEHGGRSQIFIDDGCYLLANQLSHGEQYAVVSHWYAEAAMALSALIDSAREPQREGRA
jgi:hypothetical protein